MFIEKLEVNDVKKFLEDNFDSYDVKNLTKIGDQEFEFEEMHADHIKAWSKRGHTTPENCQMLCRDCNLKKGNL